MKVWTVWTKKCEGITLDFGPSQQQISAFSNQLNWFDPNRNFAKHLSAMAQLKQIKAAETFWSDRKQEVSQISDKHQAVNQMRSVSSQRGLKKQWCCSLDRPESQHDCKPGQSRNHAHILHHMTDAAGNAANRNTLAERGQGAHKGPECPGGPQDLITVLLWWERWSPDFDHRSPENSLWLLISY